MGDTFWERLKEESLIQGVLSEIQEVLEGLERKNMVTLSTMGFYYPQNRDRNR